MPKLTEYTSYADAQAHASSAALWDLFEGNKERLNIAHECMTRHADGSGRPAGGGATHNPFANLKAMLSSGQNAKTE